MDNTGVVFFLVLLFFYFNSPDSRAPTANQRNELSNLIEQERNAVGVLATSNYGDFTADKWINITGLREEDGYAWEQLPSVKERVWKLYTDALGDWAHFKIDGKDESERPDALRGKELAVYQNVTGLLEGQWTRSKLENGVRAPSINLTALAPDAAYVTQEYNRNITGLENDIRIKLDQKVTEDLRLEGGHVREVSATVTIQDDTSSGDGWVLKMYGVHFPEFGGVFLTTSSNKFGGIFALPHFMLSEHTHNISQQLLNRTLSKAISKQEEESFTNPSYPWNSSPDSAADVLFPTPHCEYIIYLQQTPPDSMPTQSLKPRPEIGATRLAQIEQELRFPNGAPVPQAPPMQFSMLIFSPDCGFILESKGRPEYSEPDLQHLRGPKLETFINSVKTYSLVYAAICAGQVILLVRQMKDASTPSTVSRISFFTMATMTMADGLSFFIFITVSIFMDATFLVLITVSFVSFVGMAFLGMRFQMDIWNVQAPERRERNRQNAPATAPAPAIVVTPATDALPPPATARPADNTVATPVILPPDQDSPAADAEDEPEPPTNTPGNTQARRDGALWARFYFIQMVIFFLSLHATSWPTPLRSLYCNLLAFLYLSLWLPQIHRNIQRNCRKALRWDFVLGQSALRLTPLLYFYTVRHNLLFVVPDPPLAAAMAAYLWLQLLALASQELLGPRFFVPNGWAPDAYDYHPVLREGDEESADKGNLPVGFTEATSADAGAAGDASGVKGGAQKAGLRVFDCAICMQNLEVPVVPLGGVAEGESALGAGVLGRRAYMVTPCRHIFHSQCLEGWMRFRLQCPICREGLPPL